MAELHGMFADSAKPDTRDAVKEWLPQGVAFTIAGNEPVEAIKTAA